MCVCVCVCWQVYCQWNAWGESVHYEVLNYARIHTRTANTHAHPKHTHTCKVSHTHTPLTEGKVQHIQPEHPRRFFCVDSTYRTELLMDWEGWRIDEKREKRQCGREGGGGGEVHKTSMATFVGTICTPSALIRQRRQRDLSKFAQRICKATHANFCLCCPKRSGDGRGEGLCIGQPKA